VTVPFSPPSSPFLFGCHYTNTGCPVTGTAIDPTERIPLILSPQDENRSSFKHAVFLEYQIIGPSPTTHNPLKSTATRTCWQIYKTKCNLDSKTVIIYSNWFQALPI
jgi:hypothetical protein